MWKRFSSCAWMLLATSAGLAADLTHTEIRWLKGVWPVVIFARASGLPLDIVVQPQPTPGAAPLALGFVDGRCKLVLSMRGNAEADATLERLDPVLADATLELMAAHELGHCRRYVDGAWYTLPAGFAAAATPEDLSPQLHAAYSEMKAAQREEGFGDLVGLAWTRQRHPQLYARLHTWLVAERSKDLIPGSHHDTRAWLVLAANGGVFADRSPFAAAAALWPAGLAVDE